MDLRTRPNISSATLDRINGLRLGLNCAVAMRAQGGKLPAPMMPLSNVKRLPQPGGNRLIPGGVRALPLPPRPVHVPGENSFVAKMSKMTDEGEKKKKNIQLILNQLTAENFQKLCDKLYREMDSVEALEIVQTKIYDKAVLDQQQNPAPGQPTFVELYARLCHIIVQDNQAVNPTTGAPGRLCFNPDQLPPEQAAKGGQFRRSLLNRCQQEFERPPQEKCDGWQQMSDEDRFIMQTKEKRRTLGNVDFVGQLFLHGLLAEKTLHHCFKLLLENHCRRFEGIKGSAPPQDSDFDQLESLCKLLTVVGRTVDRPQAKLYMDEYFNVLQDIMAQAFIIPRMKFHIEQIVELRRCGWDLAGMHRSAPYPESANTEELVAKKKRLEGEIEALGQSIRKEEQQLKKLEDRLNEDSDKLGKVKGHMKQKQQEEEFAKLLVSLKEQFGADNVLGRVMDLCQPRNPQHSLAVFAAMQSHMDSIVVRNIDVAERCIEHIKERKVSPKTFLPLNTIKPTAPSVDGIPRGIIVRPLIDLVEILVRPPPPAAAHVCASS